jgi:DHA3 family macrolide efflux protein-like MFS transporter
MTASTRQQAGTRSVWYLWAGQTVSQIGDTIFEIGLIWLAYELTGSKSQTGLIAASAYLPALLFGLFAGSVADRFDRRRIMLNADLARLVLVSLIPLLFYNNMLSIHSLGLITVLVAFFNILFIPARDALIPELVSKDQLFKTNALMQTTWQISMLGGPLLASFLIASIGIAHLFTIDAATFLLSFLFIFMIKKPAFVKVADASKQWRFKEIFSVFRYLRGERALLILLVITAVDNLFIMGPAMVGLPIFVKENLGIAGDAGASVFASGHMYMALGMLIGTLLLNKFGRSIRQNRLLSWGIILDGLTYLPMFWVTDPQLMYLTLFCHGLFIPLIIIPRPTLVHKIVPAEMQGRIFALITISVTGFTTLSIAATGVLAEVFSMANIYAFIAVFATFTGVIILFDEDFRQSV